MKPKNNLSPGDLVLIKENYLYWGEPHTAIVASFNESDIIEKWGNEVSEECNCLLIWGEKLTPFHTEMIKLLQKY